MGTCEIKGCRTETKYTVAGAFHLRLCGHHHANGWLKGKSADQMGLEMFWESDASIQKRVDEAANEAYGATHPGRRPA